jgi:hypothetical protein
LSGIDLTYPSARAILVALLTLGLALAGSGCGASARAPSYPQPKRRLIHLAREKAPYTWLVRTAGPPPSVAQENRNSGTRAWRLPGPAADVGGLAAGPIAAYVAAQALAAGQTERIYVADRRAHTLRIRIFRIGWYAGRGGREVLESARLRIRAQPRCGHDRWTGLTPCRWHPSLRFRIPSALPTGIYIVQARAGSRDRTDCLFVVTARSRTPLLAQLSTATYEAYNAWGGDSLYPDGTLRVGRTATAQGVEVSYDRPYDSITGAGQFFARGDVSMVRFLEHYGYPVSYTDSENVDSDPGQLAGRRALLDFGHSEYWSQREATAWRRALNAGTNLAFLGSDTLDWRVRFLPAGPASSEAGAPSHVIVGYKEYAALDPDRAQPSGDFPDGGALLTGSAYVGCITPRLREPGPPVYLYYPWAPSPTLRPAWLFAGTHLSPSTTIPGITGYELDEVTPMSPRGTMVVGQGTAPCMASRRSEPGEPLPRAGLHQADTTIYTAPSGAIVFNTGTLGWELGLGPVPSASPDAPPRADPRVVAMTRNLLRRMLARGARRRARRGARRPARGAARARRAA